MKTVVIIVSSFVAVLAAGIGFLLAHDFYVERMRERYYSTHALLKAFHVAAKNADGSLSTRGPGPRQAFLAHLPVGTNRAEIFDRLGQEGFNCAWPVGHKEQRTIVCSPNEEARHTYFVPRWYVEMSLDNDGGLADAKVVMLK